MNKPMLLSEFTRLPPMMRATAFDGLSALIDTVAADAVESHHFLRYQWFAAALAAYGGRARTLIVERDGQPIIALPFTGFGPAVAKLAALPGCYWPFRGFPASADAPAAAFDILLDRLGQEVNGLRIGPSYDGDPAAAGLVAAARRRGWRVLDRFVGDSYLLDMAAARAGGGWPRASTLKKNRFHEKHLAQHGALGWHFLTGAELLADDVEWQNSGWPTIRGGARVGGMLRDMDRRGIDFEAVVHHLAADGDHVLTARTDRIGYGRFRTEFPVQGTFRVSDGRIVRWDDHFSHLRLVSSLVGNLFR